jgi:hypothetical protein
MILENPFHRLGLVADVDTKSFTKRLGLAKALLAAEMPLEFKPDLAFLGCMRNSKSLEHAERELQTALGKVQHGVLWFTSSGVVDEIALDQLRLGQFNEALAVWEKACARPEITANYVSCLNNVGTLQLFLAIANPLQNLSVDERRAYFLNGIENKVALLTKPTSRIQRGFFESIGDEIIAGQPDKIKETFKENLQRLIDTANHHGLKLTVADWADRIAGQGELAAELLAPFQGEIRARIERLVSETEDEIEKGGVTAYEGAKRLTLEAPELLQNYKNVASAGDVFVDALADKVAEAVLDGGIRYFNGLDDVGLAEVTKVRALTEVAAKIARGPQLKARLKENLDTLKKREASERETGRLRKEHNALHAALKLVFDAPVKMASKHVVAELTANVTHRWGVIDALEALEKKGVSAQGDSFKSSDLFLEACSSAANVLLNKVVAEVNGIHDNIEMQQLLGTFDLNQTIARFHEAEDACRLLSSKFNKGGRGNGSTKVFPVETQVTNRIRENHETIQGIVREAEAARRRSRSSGGCAVVFWVIGGATLLAAIASCL